ncbi:MAG: hypothetical protein R3E50_03910 [Halioglobus sp.]
MVEQASILHVRLHQFPQGAEQLRSQPQHEEGGERRRRVEVQRRKRASRKPPPMARPACMIAETGVGRMSRLVSHW